MPDEQTRLAQLNRNRANSQNQNNSDKKQTTVEIEQAEFPWGMFFLAGFFDIIGLIPIINLVTDLLGGGIIWFWQKTYDTKADPLTSFLANKITDLIFLGLWPSNIGMIMTAYIQKKIHLKEPSVGKAASRATSTPTIV